MKSKAKISNVSFGQSSESISIKGTKLFLNPNVQTSNNGRPIKYVGLKCELSKPQKWVENTFKHHWIYYFRYMDEQGGEVGFEFDYNDLFYSISKTK